MLPVLDGYSGHPQKTFDLRDETEAGFDAVGTYLSILMEICLFSLQIFVLSGCFVDIGSHVATMMLAHTNYDKPA